MRFEPTFVLLLVSLLALEVACGCAAIFQESGAARKLERWDGNGSVCLRVRARAAACLCWPRLALGVVTTLVISASVSVSRSHPKEME